MDDSRWKPVVGVGLLALLCLLFLYSTIGSTCYVAEIKAHAAQTLDEQGFTIVGYEGYTRGEWSTHGGKVRYQVVRKGDPAKHLYNLFMSKWGDEYHIYELKCVDCLASQQ